MLYRDWLDKYQHIERLGHEEVEGLLDGVVTVQPKLDGANLTVAADKEGVIIASRNQCVSVHGHPSTGFNGAVEYVLDHPHLCSLVRETGWVLRGEWLIRHSINYHPSVLKKFYVFDVEAEGRYLRPAEYESTLELLEIPYVPALGQYECPSVELLAELVQGPDAYGATQKEGIVVKRYDFRNKFGRTVWGKLISADFKVKNALTFGARKHDPVELRFVSAAITPALVLKTLHKIEDEQGRKASVRDMAQLIGRVYYDVFQEELWDFVKAKKVKDFNFHTARSLAEKSIREIALAHFNGLGPSVAESTALVAA